MQPILKVDLSTGDISEMPIPIDWQKDYIGGAGLAARILFDYLKPDLDPLGPDSPLLFLNGPLSGTYGPAVGRYVICGRSPLTGLWAESNCGGYWGAELRRTGFDGIFVIGKSKIPVSLIVNDREIEILPSEDFWGMDTYNYQKEILSRVKCGGRALSIGLGGERQIGYSSILADHGRVAGRAGLGAVMGSKMLKGIVVKGNGFPPIARFDEFEVIRSKTNRALKNDPMTAVLTELGSAGAADYLDYLGEQPKKYFSSGVLDGSEKISGASITESMLTGKKSCHGCVIACGRVVNIDGSKMKGPEYETLVGFGPNVGLTDPIFATRMGDLCDRYGIDTITMSAGIGFVIRMRELGKLNLDDPLFRKAEWGSESFVEECIHQTIQKIGLGKYLALGTYRFAKQFGLEDEVVQVNGLDMAFHDPRGSSGMSIVYATSPRGACHNQSDYFMADIGHIDPSIGMEFFDRHAGVEKVKNVIIHQDYRSIFNALVMCYFANVDPESIKDLLNSVTGYDQTVPELLQTGERIWNLKRIINFRLGFNVTTEKLPEAVLTPYTDGGSSGYELPFDKMMAKYYEFRDWDPQTGFPSETKLHSLGLASVEKGLNL
ncbi:MAG TPA: aldehyde ferredoxin oxidoreductase family protein [Anaerolineales bacterium]|nr:aldehyde ferredoxin oxidoreductase family protein [Anaerolineales bacterium]